MYGVGEKFMKVVHRFYVESRSCVQAGKDVSELFPVYAGLRHGCVMCPWTMVV